MYNRFGGFIVLIQKTKYLPDLSFTVFQLFSAFNCANNIRSPVNSLFGVKIFNNFAYFTSSSLPTNYGMGDILAGFSSSSILVFQIKLNSHMYQTLN